MAGGARKPKSRVRRRIHVQHTFLCMCMRTQAKAGNLAEYPGARIARFPSTTYDQLMLRMMLALVLVVLVLRRRDLSTCYTTTHMRARAS